MRILMRKCLLFVLAACIIFSMSGCGSTETERQSDSQGTEDPGYTDGNEGENTMKIQVGDTTLTAIMEDNSSVRALYELLAEGPLTIEMEDYAQMEKVGDLGTSLPRSDEQISTQAGDLILYQGNSFVIYYGENSWNLTRLGRIEDMDQEKLLEILGDGKVTITLSME